MGEKNDPQISKLTSQHVHGFHQLPLVTSSGTPPFLGFVCLVIVDGLGSWDEKNHH